MSEHDLGARCRSTAGIVVRAFAGLLEEQAVGGQVSVDAIRRTCAVVGGGGDALLSDLFAGSERSCQDIFAMRQMDAQRTNYIGRIVTKTFAHLLDDRAAGLSRTHLGRFFTALRMILGEEVHDDLQARCAGIAAGLAGPGGATRWEEFYRHPEVLLVRERVLVSVARTFRRFETRKDWLQIVMNSSPANRSLASSAFVAAKPGKRATDEFGDSMFLRMFDAMFACCDPETMGEGERAAFTARWQVAPEAVFGPLLVELARLRGRLSV
jgi:hypothetical protein